MFCWEIIDPFWVSHLFLQKKSTKSLVCDELYSYDGIVHNVTYAETQNGSGHGPVFTNSKRRCFNQLDHTHTHTHTHTHKHARTHARTHKPNNNKTLLAICDCNLCLLLVWVLPIQMITKQNRYLFLCWRHISTNKATAGEAIFSHQQISYVSQWQYANVS